MRDDVLALSPADRMRALVCHRLAADLAGVALERVACPEPRAGELAIAVRAAALNFPDLLMTEGRYQHRPEPPYVCGMEGAGVVVAAGAGVDPSRVGSAVYFANVGGAIAERTVVAAGAAWPIPAGLDFAQAAAFRVGAMTAWVSLVELGRLRAGETLLVHGGTGGMGVAAIQLGRHLGATVIATTRRPAQAALLERLGAEHVVIGDGGFRDAVRSLTAGAGADVVFDPVGGDVFDESVRAIAWGGRLLVVGFAGGRIPSIAANLPLIKGFSVVGVRAGEFCRRDPAAGERVRAAIERLASSGVLVPHVGARFGLDDGVAALRALAARSAPGKIVVDIDPDIDPDVRTDERAA